MKSILITMNGLKEWALSATNLAGGLLGTIVGYFLPIRDVIHFIALLFFADLFFGYLVDKKLNKGKFRVDLVWTVVIPRMIISFVLVILTFMWDTTFSQETVHTYNLIAWFISGVLIISIAENAFLLTKWKTFLKIRNILRKKSDEQTGECPDVDTEESVSEILKNKTKYAAKQ